MSPRSPFTGGSESEHAVISGMTHRAAAWYRLVPVSSLGLALPRRAFLPPPHGLGCAGGPPQPERVTITGISLRFRFSVGIFVSEHVTMPRRECPERVAISAFLPGR
jgi:hypothetical protein